MRRLGAEDIEAYLAAGEWQGKAGGYAIQGQAAAFISQIIQRPITESTISLTRSQFG